MYHSDVFDASNQPLLHLIETKLQGLIYHSDVFDPSSMTPGAVLTAWILKVPAPSTRN